MQLERNGKVIKDITVLKEFIILIFEDEKLKVSKEAYEQMNLYIGKPMTDKDIEKVKELTSISKALLYTYSLLKRKRYSEQEIKQKLYNKKLKSSQISIILEILKEKKLINDEYVKADYLELEEMKCLGKIRIISDLKNKGIHIEDSAFTYENELNKAEVQVSRIYAKLKRDSYKMKVIKITASLKYLGFEESVINEALGFVPEKDAVEEITNLKKELQKAIIRHENESDGKLLKEKLMKYLLGKGYDYNDINKLLEVTIYENDS